MKTILNGLSSNISTKIVSILKCFLISQNCKWFQFLFWKQNNRCLCKTKFWQFESTYVLCCSKRGFVQSSKSYLGCLAIRLIPYLWTLVVVDISNSFLFGIEWTHRGFTRLIFYKLWLIISILGVWCDHLCWIRCIFHSVEAFPPASEHREVFQYDVFDQSTFFQLLKKILYWTYFFC